MTPHSSKVDNSATIKEFTIEWLRYRAMMAVRGASWLKTGGLAAADEPEDAALLDVFER